MGHILGVRDIVGFHAVDVAGLRAAFEEAVIDYLDCRPSQRRVSLNQWAAKALQAAAHGYSEAAVKPMDERLYSQLLQLRKTFVMQDDTGLAGAEPAARQTATRLNLYELNLGS